MHQVDVRRGRPRSISEQVVLEAAVRRRDVNVRDLARELGTTPATVYRLFGDRGGLVRAMVRMAATTFGSPEGETWQDWLRDLATRQRRLFTEHPFVRLVDSDELAEVLEPYVQPIRDRGMSLLVDAGAPADQAVAALAAIGALATTAAALAEQVPGAVDDLYAAQIELVIDGLSCHVAPPSAACGDQRSRRRKE